MATNKLDESAWTTAEAIDALVVLDLVLGFNGDLQKVLYFQMFDLTAVPADGATPVRSFAIGPLASFSYAPSQQGRKFDPGLTFAVSTTPNVLTLAVGALFFVTLEGRFLP